MAQEKKSLGRRVVRVLVGIVVVLALVLVGIFTKNAIMARMPWYAETYYEQFQSESPLESHYAGLGPHTVSTVDFDSGDATIGTVSVWYPEDLGSQESWPLIVVVNPSNTRACNLAPCLARLASWGFIVVGNSDPQAGTGETASKTLDIMLNLSPEALLAGRIDENAIGVIGYSQGGAGAINAATAFENSSRVKALFTGSAAYSLLAMSMGWEYDVSRIACPWFMCAGTGTSDDVGVEDINAEFGGVAPLASLEESYAGASDDIFKVRARITGAEHEEILQESDGYMTAWILWQLTGDEEAAQVFVGDDAELLVNSRWQDVEKNV